MPMNHGFPADRAALTKLLFPADVPPLWSPTLVFYGEDGRIDRDRQLAHLAFMAPHVRGVLVPGSTGMAAVAPRAALLCARGYTTAVLGYMQEPGLPSTFRQIPIE